MSGANLDREAIEALAEQLYDASNTTNVPWGEARSPRPELVA
ncbi:hypothetical protein [Azospirillum thermophilum]|nr:hypothetical protein [Azospirillum thermophilum]